MDHLAERHLRLDGSADLRTVYDYVLAHRDQDVEATGPESLTDDFRSVDHRGIGYPELDKEATRLRALRTEIRLDRDRPVGQRSFIGAAPNAARFSRSVFLEGAAGALTEGLVALSGGRDPGRSMVARIDLFADGDVASAEARSAELVGACRRR